MIRLEDRQRMARDIEQAQGAGTRLGPACELAGIDVRTLQRWKAGEGLVHGDGRLHAVHPTPAHTLLDAERERIVQVANEPRFAKVPPARIVPILADEGVYLASESTFYRVLRAQDQVHPCGRAKAPRAARAHHADRPRTQSSLVLGHDVPALRSRRVLVLPLPDRGPLQPQDRGL